MEERNLRGVHSSGSGGDSDVNGGDNSDFGDSGEFVRFNDGH